MKYFYMLTGGCSVGLVAASIVGYDLSDTDIGSILQARTLDNYSDLLPRSYHLQPRFSGTGGHGTIPPRRSSPPATSQRQTPYQRPGSLQRQGPLPRRVVSKSKAGGNDKNSDDGPAASASIRAKGSAALHVMSAAEYRDAYNPHHKEGNLEVDHYHKVLAAGSIQGSPGTPIPDANKQPPADHPLIAKSRAKAVSAKVRAPRGGAGHIRIETPEKSEEFDVAGGTTETQTGAAAGSGKAKVTASVTHGGHVRVMGGPSEKSLTEFPVR